MSSDFIEKRASHEKYAQLMARAAEVTSPKTIVVYPCDATSLRGAVEAAEAELIEPVLVGPAEKIRAVAQKFGLDISRFEIVQAGPDAFVFTAGTGENLAPLRGRVASKLAWLGVKLDETANAGRMISTPDSAVAVYVIPTNDRSTYAVRVP